MTPQLGAKVLVKPVPWWLRPFADKDRKRDAGKRGVVGFVQIGGYSKTPLYTIVFDDESIGCYFEDELLVNNRPPRITSSGETVH